MNNQCTCSIPGKSFIDVMCPVHGEDEQPEFMDIKKKDIKSKMKVNIDMRKLRGSTPIEQPEQVQTWEEEYVSLMDYWFLDRDREAEQQLKDLIHKEKEKSYALGYRTGMEDGRLLEKTMNEANRYKEKLTEK